MNYRHAYHAGNFADVLKHVVLAFTLRRLTQKDKPFRVIDTHAGAGVYDLAGREAEACPEWRDGIGRLWDADIPAGAREALEPYLEALRAANPDGGLRWYPGSTALAAHFARKTDGLSACEMEPGAHTLLTEHFAGDARVMVKKADGYQALSGLLPPPERRGVVLIDPPYEHVDEMFFLAQAAKNAIERWPTGTFIFWRPLKDLWAAERFDVGLAEWLLTERELEAEKILRADLWVRELTPNGPLAGAGVVVINPPYGLEAALLDLLPRLSELFQREPGAGWRLDGAFAEDSLSVDEF